MIPAVARSDIRAVDLPSGRILTPALLFCGLSFTVPRPPDPAYPAELVTVGNHIRTRRLDLGLLQKEVAVEIGVDANSVCNWENGRTEPEFRLLPAIIGFLGYDPTPKGKTLGQRVRRMRRARGLSQKKLAQELGIDPSTVRDIEAEHLPGSRIRVFVDAFLGEDRG